VSRRHPHKKRASKGGEHPAPKAKPRLLAGIGLAPWLGALGILGGLVVGLKIGHTLIPMQIGGLLGVLSGALAEWLLKLRL
jgi:predicted lipid-binding transport protein (Tim44 family)